MKESQPGPRVTVAREALAVPDVKNNRIQLTLRDYGLHEAPYHSIAPTSRTALQRAAAAGTDRQAIQEMLTRELQHSSARRRVRRRTGPTPASSCTGASRCPSRA